MTGYFARGVFEPSNLFPYQLQDTPGIHEYLGYRNADVAGRFRARKAITFVQLERHPSRRPNTKLHAARGFLEQFQVELLAQSFDEVGSGFDVVEQSSHLFITVNGRFFPIDEVDQGVLSDLPQPPAESALGVIAKVAQLPRQFGKNRLGHILGIGILQFPSPAPTQHGRPVTVNELNPGILVERLLPQAAE
jgi:hypothetical protein